MQLTALVGMVFNHHTHSISQNSHKCVVSVLLGQDNGEIVNMVNSTGIPFEEDKNDSPTWLLDHNYIECVFDMFKMVDGACL